jgi:hypothetical protein
MFSLSFIKTTGLRTSGSSFNKKGNGKRHFVIFILLIFEFDYFNILKKKSITILLLELQFELIRKTKNTLK